MKFCIKRISIYFTSRALSEYNYIIDIECIALLYIYTLFVTTQEALDNSLSIRGDFLVQYIYFSRSWGN